jgi:hypothetical protein
LTLGGREYYNASTCIEIACIFQQGGHLRMAETKYDQYIKHLPFQNYERGCIRQGSVMDGKFLGVDAHVQYGACWNPGKMGKGPYGPHVHDFDQIMLWLGGDMNDIGELGAEVEMCMGEEMETHMITTSTAVAIPKGVPHNPGIINRLFKRCIYMEVSIAPEYKETPITTNVPPTIPAGMRSKYGKYFMPLFFRRKGAWTYGPLNKDDGGGSIAFIRTEEVGIDFVLLYVNMKKAPYRMGPDPDNPHTHPTTQIMCFLGSDPDDISQFNAEFDICLGEERERFVFSTPTAVVTPPFLPHWPGGLLKCSKPIIMADIHPFGNAH